MSLQTYFIHALTPLHPGTGQGQGLIDLPVAREVSTNHPILYGSSVKGVLRDAARSLYPRDNKKDSPEICQLFGEETGAEGDASPLRLTDARLFLLPVRSDKGTFAWVTCPLALDRLVRDGSALKPPSVTTVRSGTCLISVESEVAIKKNNLSTVMLADQSLSATSDTQDWAGFIAKLIFPNDKRWQTLLKQRLVIVSDDTFTYLAESGTEVRAQIRIDPETGTVSKGALWYSEVLPAETILMGCCDIVPNRNYKTETGWKLLTKIAQARLQLGGKASIGLGQARLVFVGGGT